MTASPSPAATVLAFLQPSRAAPPEVAPAQARKAARAATVSTPAPGSARTDAGTIRAWARQQGLDVGARGKISADVMDAYARAVTSATPTRSS